MAGEVPVPLWFGAQDPGGQNGTGRMPWHDGAGGQEAHDMWASPMTCRPAQGRLTCPCEAQLRTSRASPSCEMPPSPHLMHTCGSVTRPAALQEGVSVTGGRVPLLTEKAEGHGSAPLPTGQAPHLNRTVPDLWFLIGRLCNQAGREDWHFRFYSLSL